jgi:hypothetical protein
MKGALSSLLIVLALAAGCRPADDGVPVSQGNGSPVSAGSMAPVPDVLLRIGMGRSETALAAVNANLDADPDLEQVIAVKRMDDLSSPVRIVVADSNTAIGRYYFKSWEADASSNSVRVCRLSVLDLVGDHGMQIVLEGMDGWGLKTLDVFKRMPHAGDSALSFGSACRISADDIRIQEVARSPAYSAGTKNGDSFTIDAYSRDRDSANLRDLIRTTYAWDYAENAYVAGVQAKVTREEIDHGILDALFSADDLVGFEDFIEGSWVRTDARTASGDRLHTDEIVMLDPALRTISWSLGDTEEIYSWKESLRAGRDRILARCFNIDVRTITRTLLIRVVSADSLEISAAGTDTGESDAVVFSRITDEVRYMYLAGNGAPATAKETIEGSYRSADGIHVEFDGARLRWSLLQSDESGTYILFSVVDRRILSIRFQDEDGAPEGIRYYLFESGQSAQRIVLTPIRLVMQGYEIASGEQIVLEKESQPPAG